MPSNELVDNSKKSFAPPPPKRGDRSVIHLILLKNENGLPFRGDVAKRQRGYTS